MATLNRTQLGIVLGGLSDRQIKTLINKGMPVITQADRDKGIAYEFDEQDCVDWYQDYETTKQHAARIKRLEADAAKEPDKDLKAAKLTKINLENARLRLKLDNERGELVSIPSVVEIVTHQLSNMKVHLRSLPHKLAPLLEAGGEVDEIDKILTSYINEALEELSVGRVMERFTDEESSEDAE